MMTDRLAQAEIEGQAKALGDAHARIEAIDSLVVVQAWAARLDSSDWPQHTRDELMHHLERKRVELLRKSGALSP